MFLRSDADGRHQVFHARDVYPPGALIYPGSGELGPAGVHRVAEQVEIIQTSAVVEIISVDQTVAVMLLAAVVYVQFHIGA